MQDLKVWSARRILSGSSTGGRYQLHGTPKAKRPSKKAFINGKCACRDRAHMERRVYPHLFRKTTATNITRRGGSVQDAGDYIGHKDNSVTARFYAFKGKDHTEEIFRKYVAIV